MPSAQDFLDAINNNTTVVSGRLDTVNSHLASIEGKLDALNASVKAVDADVKILQQLSLWGFQQLITLGQYTNQALFHNDQQNDTMICQLQEIAVNTCCICNETHTQTPLQEAIKEAIRKLTCMYATTNADAALTHERQEKLREQIVACCPPEAPAPACVEKPCPEPRPFDEKPPKTDPPPKVGRIG
jgi:hypothetical protein